MRRKPRPPLPSVILAQHEVVAAPLVPGLLWPYIEPPFCSTCIYLARRGRLVKIGRTDGLAPAVSSRLYDLSRETGEEHRALAIITGCVSRHETFLHRALKAERVFGEYFSGFRTELMVANLALVHASLRLEAA